MSIYIQSSADLSLFAKKLSSLSGVPQAPIKKALSASAGARSVTEYEYYLDNSHVHDVRDDINGFLRFCYENTLLPGEIHQQVEAASPSTYPTLKALKDALSQARRGDSEDTPDYPIDLNDKQAWSSSLTIPTDARNDNLFMHNGKSFVPFCELCETAPVYESSPEITRCAAVVSGLGISVKKTCTFCHPIVSIDSNDDARFLYAFSLNPSYSQGNISSLLFEYERLQRCREAGSLDACEERVLPILKIFFEDLRKQCSVLQNMMGSGFVQAMFAISKHLSTGVETAGHAELEQIIREFHSCMTVIDGRRLGLPHHTGENGLVIKDKGSLDRVARVLSSNTKPGREQWKGLIANAVGFNKVASLIAGFKTRPAVATVAPPAFSAYMAEVSSSYISAWLHKYLVEFLSVEEGDIQTVTDRVQSLRRVLSNFINDKLLESLGGKSSYAKVSGNDVSACTSGQRGTVLDYQALMASIRNDNNVMVIRLVEDDGMSVLCRMIDDPELFAGVGGSGALRWLEEEYPAFRRMRVSATKAYLRGVPSLSTLRYYVKNYAKSHKVVDVALSQFVPCPTDEEVKAMVPKVHKNNARLRKEAGKIELD